MKRVLSLLLVCVLIVTLSACGKQDTAESTGFVKPDSYACVLTVTINPQFALYLDESNKVLALEAINEDAESIKNTIDLTNTDLEAVVQEIITVANEKGLIKTETIIDLKIAETKNGTINTADSLNKAYAAAAKAAIDLNIPFTVNTEDETEPVTTSSTAGTQTKATTTVHTHAFSEATCQKPATCSCGATQGTIGAHMYKSGKCSVCGTVDAIDPKTGLKTDIEYIGNFRESGDMLLASALQFDSECCVLTDRFFSSVRTDDAQTPVRFNGKHYYSEGGGFSPYVYELTDTEIIVKHSLYEENSNAVTLKLTLQSNGILRVTESTNVNFPKGTVLSTNMNDVI